MTRIGCGGMATIDTEAGTHNALCFVDGDWPLIAPPDVFRGVRLESTQSLRRRLGRTSVIDEAAIAGLMQILAGALPRK